jgi:hypothetical protein
VESSLGAEEDTVFQWMIKELIKINTMANICAVFNG